MRGAANMASALEEVDAKVNEDIILVLENLGDSLANPSAAPRLARGYASTRTRARRRSEAGATNFFITGRLTFSMSTRWLNSGGNLVDFISRASTLEAIVGNGLLPARERLWW